MKFVIWLINHRANLHILNQIIIKTYLNIKHIKLTIDNPDLDNIDKPFYTYINEYKNKYEYYLVRCEFKLVFSNMEDYPVASSKLTDNKTCLLYTSPSPRDGLLSRMPSSA